MNQLTKAGRAVALLAGALLLSACSVSINTGAATPTPSATPAPTPTPKVVSVVISNQVDSGRCETSADTTVLIDGRDVGTMRVDNQAIHTDRMTVMMTPANHNYSLKGTAFFQANGQSLSLAVSGSGQVQVTDGPNSWSLAVDPTRLPAGGCPAAGSSWPLVLQT